jgi:hypothetical protein
MKLFFTGVFLLCLHANHAFSQTEKPTIVTNCSGNYIQSTKYSQTRSFNRFNLMLPSQTENRFSMYSTIRLYNYKLPYQTIKTPIWHSIVSLAGQLSLSVFAERHQLYYHLPVQSNR